MIQVDERLFQQEWYLDLDVEARWLYLYLLSTADKKTGIFEVNMRTINFYVNGSRKYTKEDIFSLFGDRIIPIPNHENTAIFPKFIQTNWAKNETLNMSSRLSQAIIASLGKFGLTIADINKWTGSNIRCVNGRGDSGAMHQQLPCESCIMPVEGTEQSEAGELVAQAQAKPRQDTEEVDMMFAEFWKSYPSSKRKIDKQGCLRKWRSIFVPTKDRVALFNRVMDGLDKWKASDEWRRGYEPMTHKFLNQRYWETTPEKCKGVNNGSGQSVKQSENAIKTDQYNGLF